MKMKSECLPLLIAMVCLSLTLGAEADITVSVNPPLQSIFTGNSTYMDVDIAGLGSGIGLGGFSIGLTYNPTVVHLDGLTFGNGLNLGVSGNSLQYSDPSTSGYLLVDETSLLGSAALIAGQAGGFNLFRIGFTGLIDGTSPVSLSQVELSDQGGETLSAAQIMDGSIDVPDTLPFGWIALVLGLVVITGTRRQLAKE
jgi:hypothetical protein